MDAGTTRLVVRVRADYPPGPLAHAAAYLVFERGDSLLQSLKLAGIRTRAERTPT
jgi:hypothetical protein